MLLGKWPACVRLWKCVCPWFSVESSSLKLHGYFFSPSRSLFFSLSLFLTFTCFFSSFTWIFFFDVTVVAGICITNGYMRLAHSVFDHFEMLILSVIIIPQPFVMNQIDWKAAFEFCAIYRRNYFLQWFVGYTHTFHVFLSFSGWAKMTFTLNKMSRFFGVS